VCGVTERTLGYDEARSAHRPRRSRASARASGSRDVIQRQLDGSLPPPIRELTSRTTRSGCPARPAWSDEDRLLPFLGDIFLAHAVTLVVTALVLIPLWVSYRRHRGRCRSWST
jgi:hypothetical protein